MTRTPRRWPGLAALLLLGCPPPPPRTPQQLPSPDAGAPRQVRPERPLTLRPSLRRPPFGLALSVAGGSAGERAELGRRLRRVLRVSGLFVVADGAAPADEPGARGAAHSVVAVMLVHRQPGEASARVTITLPGAGADGATARRQLTAPTPRRLALALAATVCQHHLDEPGPFLSPVAFVAPSASGRGRQVFLVDFDGEGVRRVSREMGTLNILPRWSRRGDLVFTSYANGGPQLALLPSGAVTPRLLPSRGGLNSGAAFAPDGQRIAVTISRGGNTDIYLVDRRGGLVARLTKHRRIDISPSFSPDGRRLAFVSDRSGSPQVYVMDLLPSGAPAGAPRRLTARGGYNQEPAWCPVAGSEQIAFTRRYPGERYAIHVIDARSREERRLTGQNLVSQRPSWSPRCRSLVFSRAGRALWLVTADGRVTAELYRGTARTPAWAGNEQ